MRRRHISFAALFILGLVGCTVDDDARADGSGERGTWDPGTKADDAATCAGSCFDQAPAGCWCDEECSTWGDCCPDIDLQCGLPGGSGDAGSLGDDCSLPTDGAWSCNGLTGTTTDPESTYFTTSFGCWIDSNGKKRGDVSDNCIPACSLDSIGCSGMTGPDCERDLQWYAADSDRFGCGTKLLVTNPDNGKSAVLIVIDRGPNCRIEKKVNHWVLDMSYPASYYLFDEPTSATDRADVEVMVVNDDTPLGPSDSDVSCSGGGFGGDPQGGGSDEVCFPGKQGGDTCFSVTTLPPGTTGYKYPAPYQGNANYRSPIAYLDLNAIPSDTWLAPNFQLGEFAQTSKGRYAVVQPHLVERVQDLRDRLGALKINSGYRSPTYNASVGGAQFSRHMYGDAIDIQPLSASLGALESACEDEGGTLVEYENHVHCDWRDDPLNASFYGAAASLPLELRSEFAAELVEDDGQWSVVAFGFDEGDPLLRWTALDERGDELTRSIGPTFLPPAGTAQVRVLVGARVELEGEIP